MTNGAVRILIMKKKSVLIRHKTSKM